MSDNLDVRTSLRSLLQRLPCERAPESSLSLRRRGRRTPSPSFVGPNDETVKITDEISNTTLEVTVDFSRRNRNKYSILLYEVYKKLGLHMNCFQLCNVRNNRLYPMCMDYMIELLHKPLAEMDIKADDTLLIVRKQPTTSPSADCQGSSVSVANKMTQAEPEELIRIRMTPMSRGKYDVGELDVYVRKQGRIRDVFDELKKDDQYFSRNSGFRLVHVYMEYKGEKLNEDDTTCLASAGIFDGAVVKYDMNIIYLTSPKFGCYLNKSERIFAGEPSLSIRSVGVQTVAIPVVQYPLVQPPPPVNNPPPAKT